MYTQNCTMKNHQQDLVDLLDTESVQFVNPYDINPIIDVNLFTRPVSHGLIKQAGFIETQEDIKPLIKMEEFSDLSYLTTPTEPTLNASIDELTTPIFEKGPMNFLSHNVTKVDTSKYQYNVKSEQNSLYASEDNINFNDLNSVKNLLSIPEFEMLPNQNTYAQESNNSFNLNTNEDKNIRENIFNFDDFVKTTASAEIINIVDDNDQYYTNIYTPENTPSYVSSPKDTPTISYVNSPEDPNLYMEEPTVIHTPEDSNSSLEQNNRIMFQNKKVPLKVKVESLPNISSVNTPDVINQVVDLGDDFNILDLVSNEDLRVLETDDDFLSTITSPLSSTPTTPASVKGGFVKSIVTTKRSRRRKSSYYEDKEYMPHSKKRSTVCLQDIEIKEDSDSDYEYRAETQVASNSGKSRGRPSKKSNLTEPKDYGVSKYRELRDKNNEASRKSRLKRKCKDQELETEADELHIKNIKLKAQVEELEKMVTTFRDNLFHIMIKK